MTMSRKVNVGAEEKTRLVLAVFADEIRGAEAARRCGVGGNAEGTFRRRRSAVASRPHAHQVTSNQRCHYSTWKFTDSTSSATVDSVLGG